MPFPSDFSQWFSWPDITMKIARAVVIAITFEILTFIASRQIEKHLRDVFATDAHRDPARRARRRSKLRAAARGASRAAFYPLAFLVMLEIFGIPPQALGVAFIAVVATALVAGHAWLRDVIAGLIILGEDQFAVGDRVRIGEVEGVVERMSLRSTWVRPQTGEGFVVIPNRVITTTHVPSRTAAS